MRHYCVIVRIRLIAIGQQALVGVFYWLNALAVSRDLRARFNLPPFPLA